MARKKKEISLENCLECGEFRQYDHKCKTAEPEEFIAPALTEVERLSLRLYEAEARAANLEANIRNMNRAAYIKQIDPENKLGAMENEIRGSMEVASIARKKYLETTQAIEARLNIKMAEYTFDDETGALLPVA